MATGCGYGESQPEPEEIWRSTTVAEFLDWENSDASSRGLKPLLHNNKISCMNSLKPSLPPKPPHGPPLYREPPVPPQTSPPTLHRAYRSQPDVCSLTPRKPTNTANKYNDNIETTFSTTSEASFSGAAKADIIDSVVGNRPSIGGTQAWVREHKSHGNMVGERLSSLQRKLRSLLTQTQQKTGDLHSIDSTKRPQSRAECGSLASLDERSDQSRHCSNPNRELVVTLNDQHHSYVCASPTANTIVMPGPVQVSNSTVFSSIERHPFEPELEDSRDTTHIRDTCNKLFSRDIKSPSCSSYMNQRSNCYTNNIKSAFDYDKLVPKEVIGKPCQEKRILDVSSNIDTCEKPNQNSSVTTTSSDRQYDMTKPVSNLEPETIYYSMKTLCYIQDPCQEPNPARKNAKAPFQKVANSHKPCVDNNGTTAASIDCGDTSDQYKSSSESGHGTMHSCSIRDNKSLASAYSSRISALSHLDTSLDSDHSANCSLWDNSHHTEWAEKLPTSKHATEDGVKQAENETASLEQNSCAESPSGTPPLPPLSPPPLSPLRTNCSPQASPKQKYKLPLSPTTLNSHANKASELEPNDSECSKSKNETSALPKNTGNRRNAGRKSTSAAPTACRHWSGKGKSYRSSSNIPHRTVYSCRKTRCSPFSKQPGLSLALPSYADYADPEWTSTTTGLDGESLIDDQDDLSSDLSMSTSTMDPVELGMIRKQLEGLENMYSEILHLLGVKSNSCKAMARSAGSTSDLRHPRCRISGSLSSLTARSSNSRGNHTYADRRGLFEKRRGKDLKNGSASKRLQRLESHVVTLARSVAHLSSEMRTQHMLVEELEHMRRDVTWVHERLRLMQLAQSSPGTSGHSHNNKGVHMPLQKDWDFFRKEVNELLNPNRAKKLTKFFGDEPPLIRQFLKRLGYEKYAAQFESEKIGIMELPYLTEERLQKIGVPMGPRIRIMQEAHAYCQQNQYKVYIV